MAILNAMYTLARVYLEKNDLDEAQEWCRRIIRKQSATLGDKNVLFMMSVSLLVQIYEKRGDHDEAEGHRSLLPLHFDGNALFYPETN